jgi:hypothetical protein
LDSFWPEWRIAEYDTSIGFIFVVFPGENSVFGRYKAGVSRGCKLGGQSTAQDDRSVDHMLLDG